MNNRKYDGKRKFRKLPSTQNSRSAAVASIGQVERWYRNLENFLREHSANIEGSYLDTCMRFQEQQIAAYELYANPLIQAAPWVGPVGPYVPMPKPADMKQRHYNNFINIIITYDQANLWNAAGPAAHAAAPAADWDPTEAQEFVFPGIEEAELDNVIVSVLVAYAHSGFTGLGDLTQTIYYVCFGIPTDYPHEFQLSELDSALPPGITHMKLGRAHANQIARYLKDEDIMTDWGIRHNVPIALNHLSFACWDYVTDKDLINEDYKRQMRSVSAVAIRDQAQIEYEDPTAPHVNAHARQELAVLHTNARHQTATRSAQRTLRARASMYANPDFFNPPNDADDTRR